MNIDTREGVWPSSESLSLSLSFSLSLSPSYTHALDASRRAHTGRLIQLPLHSSFSISVFLSLPALSAGRFTAHCCAAPVRTFNVSFMYLCCCVSFSFCFFSLFLWKSQTKDLGCGWVRSSWWQLWNDAKAGIVEGVDNGGDDEGTMEKMFDEIRRLSDSLRWRYDCRC